MTVKDLTEYLIWYNAEMEDYANGYAAFLEQVEAAKETCSDPAILIEQRVDFSRWVEQGFGTADCIIIADYTPHRRLTAELAFAGDGNFLCGEWCGFCKAKHECRARAEANLLLAQHDFKLPSLLEDSEIEVILSRVDELVAWASDIKECSAAGSQWKGMARLQAGRRPLEP